MVTYHSAQENIIIELQPKRGPRSSPDASHHERQRNTMQESCDSNQKWRLRFVRPGRADSSDTRHCSNLLVERKRGIVEPWWRNENDGSAESQKHRNDRHLKKSSDHPDFRPSTNDWWRGSNKERVKGGRQGASGILEQTHNKRARCRRDSEPWFGGFHASARLSLLITVHFRGWTCWS